MSQKVAIVTGSNKGIGKGIVQHLCQQFPGIVYLTSRNEKLGQEAVADLEKLGLKPKYHQLDIDDVKSIERFGDFIQKTHGGIDILVNNAGMAYKQAATEPFSVQAEHTVRVNFTGTVNICKILFPLLNKHARVVNVSSSAGHLSMLDSGKEPESIELKKKFASDDLTENELIELMNDFVQSAKEGNHSQKGWINSTYCVSKIGMSALTRVHQKEFDENRPADDIVINAAHPGYVDTDMTSHKGHLTIDQGVVAPVWLALLPENIQTPRGGYVWHDKTIVDWAKGLTPGRF